MLLGPTRDQITELNTLICGTQTIESAPDLKEEHLPVFDCANKCGPNGKRYIASSGHIPDDGGAAVHLRPIFQDDQPAQRSDDRQHRRVVLAQLGTRTEGERPLPGWLPN